jgi:hypothetical protein
LLAWFGPFFKADTRKQWLETNCHIAMVGVGNNRQLFLSKSSRITRESVNLLPGVNEEYIPSNKPNNAALQQEPDVLVQEDDSDDKSSDEEFEISSDEEDIVGPTNLARVRFSAAKPDTRLRIVNTALKSMKEAVTATLHPNGHEDVNAVISAATDSMEKRIAKIADRNGDMEANAKNPVVKGLAESYISAPKKEKMQLLSSLAQHFTLNGLNRYVFADTGIKISKFLLSAAREHADAVGPGRSRLPREKDVRNRLDTDELAFCYAVILPYVDSHAYGLRSENLDRKGASLLMPKTTSSKSTDELINIYNKAITDNPIATS